MRIYLLAYIENIVWNLGKYIYLKTESNKSYYDYKLNVQNIKF